MENLLIYMIKVNGSLILFYLCYKLFFQRDTFWMIRRIYLLVSVLFSFIYPLISVEGWIKKQ
ncbi:MAG TPA: energy transducer TonB, partial [Paludibacteraceae bacterium]|nr:energy transducer TonB [Paludibacteraceae bacterium]